MEITQFLGITLLLAAYLALTIRTDGMREEVDELSALVLDLECGCLSGNKPYYEEDNGNCCEANNEPESPVFCIHEFPFPLLRFKSFGSSSYTAMVCACAFPETTFFMLS